jgi:two-component system, NarL family, invasion response regulator UvrY
LGYRTEIALHGQEALDLLCRPNHGVTLVLSDWIMPHMGGEALVGALRARAIEVPVIIVSGHPMSYYDRAEAMPVTDWLQKPVDLNQLARAIATTLAPSDRAT